MCLRMLLITAATLAPNSAMIAADRVNESQAIREIGRGGNVKAGRKS
jgi:hypothetical protein